MVAVLLYNACCISKLRIFLFYGHPWIPLCLDKGGLTVQAKASFIKVFPIELLYYVYPVFLDMQQFLRHEFHEFCSDFGVCEISPSYFLSGWFLWKGYK